MALIPTKHEPLKLDWATIGELAPNRVSSAPDWLVCVETAAHGWRFRLWSAEKMLENLSQETWHKFPCAPLPGRNLPPIEVPKEPRTPRP